MYARQSNAAIDDESWRVCENLFDPPRASTMATDLRQSATMGIERTKIKRLLMRCATALLLIQRERTSRLGKSLATSPFRLLHYCERMAYDETPMPLRLADFIEDKAAGLQGSTESALDGGSYDIAVHDQLGNFLQRAKASLKCRRHQLPSSSKFKMASERFSKCHAVRALPWFAQPATARIGFRSLTARRRRSLRSASRTLHHRAWGAARSSRGLGFPVATATWRTSTPSGTSPRNAPSGSHCYRHAKSTCVRQAMANASLRSTRRFLGCSGSA